MKLEITPLEIQAAILDHFNKKLGTTFNKVNFKWSYPVTAELIEVDEQIEKETENV